jgi:hypothetical protein
MERKKGSPNRRQKKDEQERKLERDKQTYKQKDILSVKEKIKQEKTLTIGEKQNNKKAVSLGKREQERKITEKRGDQKNLGKTTGKSVLRKNVVGELVVGCF